MTILTVLRQTLCRYSPLPINNGPPFTPVRESLYVRLLKKGSLYALSPSPGFTMLIWRLLPLPSLAAFLIFFRQALNNIALPSLTALSVWVLLPLSILTLSYSTRLTLTNLVFYNSTLVLSSLAGGPYSTTTASSKEGLDTPSFPSDLTHTHFLMPSSWCPDQDTSPSPSHSITLCCGSAYSANASSHGHTFGYRDWHAKLPQGKGWRAGVSHTPQYEPVSILFYRLLEYWTGFLKLDRAAFVDPVSAAFTLLPSHYSPGLPAWSLPPHTLAHNLFALLFTIFYRPARLISFLLEVWRCILPPLPASFGPLRQSTMQK